MASIWEKQSKTQLHQLLLVSQKNCRQTEEERLRLSLYEGCTEIQMDGWTDGHTDGPRTDSHTEITPCSTGFVPFRATAKKEMLPALFSSSGCDKKLILCCVLRLINDSFWFRKRQKQTKTNSQTSRHKQTQPEKRKMERDRQAGRQTDRQTETDRDGERQTELRKTQRRINPLSRPEIRAADTLIVLPSFISFSQVLRGRNMLSIRSILLPPTAKPVYS